MSDPNLSPLEKAKASTHPNIKQAAIDKLSSKK
jgi:hypothetical protein